MLRFSGAVLPFPPSSLCHIALAWRHLYCVCDIWFMWSASCSEWKLAVILLLHLFSCLHQLSFPPFYLSICYILTYLLTHSLTHSLTPFSTVLLKKLTGSQLVKKFPIFYGTRRFITAFPMPGTYPYPEPAGSSPYPHIPLPEYPS